MSKESDDKIRKSRAKLDRLLIIKKAIMDSLSLISRNDRATPSHQRCNVIQNGHKEDKSSEVTTCVRKLERGLQNKHQVDVVRRPVRNQESSHVLMDPNSQLQSSCQTWPRDVHFGKDFADFCPKLCEPQRLGLKSDLSHVEPPLRVGVRTRATETIQVKGLKECNAIISNQDIPKMTESLVSMKHDEIPGRALKSQEVQTDPEIARQDAGDIDHVNADIIRYLNQVNDKEIFRSYEPELKYRSGGFSPLYDMYEERFCFRYKGAQHNPPEEVQMFRHRECNTHPVQQQRRDCFVKKQFSNQNDPHSSKRVPSGFPLTDDSMYLSAPYPDTRALSDDSGSVFSSEADSDFTFYPCTSLAEPFNRLALVDSRVGSLFSPPPDMPDINASFSWRSDLFGSSLDDVTQQFFFDEDALSDDVFLDDPMDNSAVRPANRSHASPCDQVSRSFENPLYDSPKLINVPVSSLRDELGKRNSSSEDYYAYRYADIDEVLQGYSGTERTSSFRVIHENGILYKHTMDSGEIPRYTCLGTEELSNIKRSESNDSRSSSTKEELHFDLGQEFAHVFDSLRRNSTQSKARKMWRQRRANTKKRLIQDSSHEPATTSSSTMVFTFEHVTSKSRYSDSSEKPPPKPLRGILKNKGNVSPTNIVSESKLCETVPSGQWVGVNHHLLQDNLNHASLGESVAAEMNENQMAEGKRMERRSDFIKGVQILAGNPATSKQIHKHFPDELFMVQDQENVLLKRQQYGNTNVEQHFKTHNANQVQRESQLLVVDEKAPHMKEKFHTLQMSTDSGSDKFVTVRKNSVEVYKWTQSLQRRKKRLAKKVTRQISHCCASSPFLDQKRSINTSATI